MNFYIIDVYHSKDKKTTFWATLPDDKEPKRDKYFFKQFCKWIEGPIKKAKVYDIYKVTMRKSLEQQHLHAPSNTLLIIEFLEFDPEFVEPADTVLEYGPFCDPFNKSKETLKQEVINEKKFDKEFKAAYKRYLKMPLSKLDRKEKWVDVPVQEYDDHNNPCGYKYVDMHFDEPGFAGLVLFQQDEETKKKFGIKW